jgi:uncharacterized circularly permuted ATP-grasp superfamily protein/uncharacterized alpha-E superfamily protein
MAVSGLRYVPVAGHYDEMTLPTGELRPPWKRLMTSLERLGADELGRRWREAQRLIEENGVTYNVYGDPRGIDRPWRLDPIPFLITSSEWAVIEASIIQRATLLDRVLADLYGPGRLLREGGLPPELVFANPGFLRPLRGVPVRDDLHLHVYAADLARSADGQWWVLADRTEAPSGAGYALENRVVLSRILPEVQRQFYVRRLAGWFQAYRETLRRLAPPGREEPRIVLLTPGPYNETYFEHAYLARYLGFTLAEGADLTVRGERVFLKTLSGLRPVDVILRRQDSPFCDPLELLGESALGIAGLVQAVRAGTVTVANALGSGLVETAATMAFLPGLCRMLLGEELRMPSVASWWCGQPRELAYVAEHLDGLVVKPTFPGWNHEVVFGRDLDAKARAAFLDELRATPERFVAQEQVALSTAPIGGQGQGTEPRHLVLRVYAVASQGSWVVMPGGLTRVSTSTDNLVVSSQRGGASKDTWVLADAPVPFVSLMDQATRPADVSRATYALTSRVADNLLWLGRLSERTEAGVRLFRCALRRLAEEPLRPAGAPVPDALQLLSSMVWVGDADAVRGEAPEEAILAELFDRDRPESLAATAAQLHRTAWQLRDRISPDAWRFLGRLDNELVAPATHPALRVGAVLAMLDDVLMIISAFTGVIMEGTTRGLGWRFLDVGRRIERGIQLVELLRHGLVDEPRNLARRLGNLLDIADSAMTYRSRYQTSARLELVLDLLLLDRVNPRSLIYQVENIEERFAVLPKAPHEAAQELVSLLRAADIELLTALDRRGKGRRRPKLASLLGVLAVGLPALADGLGHAYLSHAIPRRQPVGLRRRR